MGGGRIIHRVQREYLGGRYEQRIPPVDGGYDQELLFDGQAVGEVNVILYHDPKQVLQAYEQVAFDFENAAVPEAPVQYPAVGEQAALLPGTAQFIGDSVVFTRCHALVHLSVPSHTTEVPTVDAVAYAKRLDQRIQEIVCR